MTRTSRRWVQVKLVAILVAFFLLVWPWGGIESLPHIASHLVAGGALVVYLLLRERENSRRARELFRAIDSMADWAVVVDEAGKVVHASASINRYGYEPDLIEGMDWSDLTPMINHEIVQRWIREIGPGTPGTLGPFVADLAALDGSLRTYEVSVCRLELSSGRFMAGLFRDITERQQMERAMTSMDRLAAVAHLADGVAHNFNNIFGGMMLNTELLLRGREEEREAFADRIVAGAERGADLCRKLLTLARGEPPCLSAVPVRPLAADLVSLLETKLSRRSITIHSDLAESLRVWADPSQLRQILVDLLFSAAELAEDGGWIRISGRRAHDQAFLAVSNSGPPIPPDRLPLIFLPFYSTRTDSVQATGVGLAVSKRLAEGMGGGLDAVSGIDQLTTFTLRLPAEQPREDVTAPCAS